jgi:DNA repair exonuclease SbcCD ATPase subunit
MSTDMSIEQYRDKISQAKGRLAGIKKEAHVYRGKVEQCTSRTVNLEQALVFVQDVAQRTQEQLTLHIEDVVNTALDTCFPDEYQFKLVFEIKRNKTEARLVFHKNGFEIDPMEASGGGVVDVASFALRIAAWSLGKTNNVICLDEPMKFLSRDLQPRAGEILKEISSKLGLQFIMVSHVADIIQSADRVFETVLKHSVASIVRRDA